MGYGVGADASERVSLKERGLLCIRGFARRQLGSVDRVARWDIEVQRQQVLRPVVPNFMQIAMLY